VKAKQNWVGTWASAPQLVEPGNLAPAPGLAQNTLRQVVYVSIGASRLRIRFSNAYGNGSVELRRVELALSSGGDAIDAASSRPLRFAGAVSVTIPAGAELTSDPLDFALEPQTKLALSIAFGSVPSDVTGHPGSRTTSYLAPGDAASAPSLPSAVRVEHWYYLAGIEVVAEGASGAVITLGDSITDGRGSTTDGNDRWPDNLSRRLRANPSTSAIAVLNMGIGGNAVLAGGLGPTAKARFQRDVLEQNGARFVIVFHGVNDVGGAKDRAVVAGLTRAYQELVSAARARGLKIYGAPLLPFAGSQYDSSEHETARQAVNAWIRTPGHFDAVIDFDAAVSDPASPTALLAAYDSGDHLHLSAAGYVRLADAIDLALFSP
jgi:lysophospholipase L1-like esterase